MPGQTVMQLENVWVQEIFPTSFGIYACDQRKRNIPVKNYFNLGFFAQDKDGTIPIGNLADCGFILSQSKDNADWINVSNKDLTTLIVTTYGDVSICKTNSLEWVKNLQSAVSGIPILRRGRITTMDDIRSEGYFGNELYFTWHGFLGIRNGMLVYVAAECDYNSMPWILLALGIKDAIKLDGGGSFILVNGGKELVGTKENRKINNIGMWEE